MAREHNNKCMKAKGEGPQGSLREARAQHALAACAGRTHHRTSGEPPPAASTDRVLFLLCGAANKLLDL
jgi:hypothetical protein